MTEELIKKSTDIKWKIEKLERDIRALEGKTGNVCIQNEADGAKRFGMQQIWIYRDQFPSEIMVLITAVVCQYKRDLEELKEEFERL